MKVVPPSDGSEDAKENSPLVIPEVEPMLYGEVFHQADWLVTQRPWERLESRFVFEHWDSSNTRWKASLDSSPGLATFRMTRVGEEAASGSERLELRLMSSDFLQGYDYELNVRYASERWDEEDWDVIVLRAYDSVGGQLHPGGPDVARLRDALRILREKMDGEIV
ncbi:hypothetical protein AAFN60_15005 [Roseibacillus persicicus]|uniref:hypothetical protein n=1 Tax=Roseibacillus persicicus TaxID=454148 RepID=UPI00398B5D15